MTRPVEDVEGEVQPDTRPPEQSDSTEGEALVIRAPGGNAGAAAFRPADPELGGHLILDFDGFDAWYEEDEQIFGHPRDP
jgi:hypothetical protein